MRSCTTGSVFPALPTKSYLKLTVSKLLQDHLKEMFGIIYTPTESVAIQNFSRVFRRPEGCFLNINDTERVFDDLAIWGNAEDIDYIVVTGKCPLATILVLCLTVTQMRKRSWALATRASGGIPHFCRQVGPLHSLLRHSSQPLPTCGP